MKRLLYIDNLRWTMIMLVVSMHAAVTYSHIGSWYYMENAPVSPAETAIFGTYQATLQDFFMGFLFFIAGYFVPRAYDTKGPWRFLRDRAYRLGLPLLLYMFVVQPVAVWCISSFGGENVFPDGFLHGYAHYITSGRWIGGTGPLWFCEALLIFCVGYMLVRAFGRVKATKTPTKTSIWLFIGAVSVCTFAIRFPWPVGTAFYNLQFCYFSQYVFFFAAGTLAYSGGWLDRLDNGRFWGRVALIGGSLFWVAILVLGGAMKGHVPYYQGGAHWQSLGMSFWESMMGVSISIWLLQTFRRHFDRQGRWAKFFSANAFAVYVFHAPVLIALSRWMSPLAAPLLPKFLLLTVAAIAVSFAVCAAVLRKLPFLRRIL